ncbi:hypothetical protein J437_LFUL001066 [Ladona fulva]|uniref:Ig-like domain-containing protein n=1 Tax=Ladona fulva TaxID=123851 RepID=A0A8K0K6A5_LADFU|nr:hypothetical protein J437_LFUL001066 [Ladona fulva]
MDKGGEVAMGDALGQRAKARDDGERNDKGFLVPIKSLSARKSAISLVKGLQGPGGVRYPGKAIVVREGENVRLRCAATGVPRPDVEWKKQDGSVIPLGAWKSKYSTCFKEKKKNMVDKKRFGCPYLFDVR